MTKRKLLVKSLIENIEDMDILINKLSNYPWDSKELVILTRQDIRNALNQYLEGKIASFELENWANAVEMRDDIEYEPGHVKIISNTLMELANQEIYQPINKNNVEVILSKLR